MEGSQGLINECGVVPAAAADPLCNNARAIEVGYTNPERVSALSCSTSYSPYINLRQIQTLGIGYHSVGLEACLRRFFISSP